MRQSATLCLHCIGDEQLKQPFFCSRWSHKSEHFFLQTQTKGNPLHTLSCNGICMYLKNENTLCLLQLKPQILHQQMTGLLRVQRVGDNEVRHKQPAHPGGVSTVKREGIWQLDCVKSTIVQCKQTKRLLTGQQ